MDGSVFWLVVVLVVGGLAFWWWHSRKDETPQQLWTSAKNDVNNTVDAAKAKAAEVADKVKK